MREEDINKMIEEEIKEDIQMEEAVSEIKSTDEEQIEIEWVDCDDSSDKKRKFKKLSTYDIVRYVVMAIALIAFGYASYELTLIYVDSVEGEEAKEQAADMFLVDYDSLTEGYEPVTDENGEIIIQNTGDGQLFVFDYEKMLQYNSEAKGYIRQDNGEYIDNPILQHSDNDYYLTHLANNKKGSSGAIFIDAYIEEGLEARNCIVHGHNMGQRVGNIMFGSLNWYYNKTGYYKEHPTFDIWIENRHYRYYVFAVYKTEITGTDTYTYSFSSDDEFLNYVERCKSKSKYNFTEAPKITADSKIITLSTCTNTDFDKYRMIVQLVRGERLDIYGNPIEDDAAGDRETISEAGTLQAETTVNTSSGNETQKQSTEEKTTAQRTTTQRATTTQRVTTPEGTTAPGGTTTPGGTTSSEGTTTPEETTTSEEATTPVSSDSESTATTPEESSTEESSTEEGSAEEGSTEDGSAESSESTEPAGDSTDATDESGEGEVEEQTES